MFPCTAARLDLLGRLERRLLWAAVMLGLVVLLVGCGQVSCERERVRERGTSFSKAKRLAAMVYAGRRETFYCGCAYAADGRVDAASGGYIPRHNTERSRRVEWEHVVPAQAFGHSFRAWRDGHWTCVDRKGKTFKGRACARKVSAEFRRMESDLHNLVPAIGEVNARRQNFSMAMIPGETRSFGACDLEIAGRKIEPRPEIRGDIARTYFYMDSSYPGHGVVSRKTRALFAAWAAEDPVDSWECLRAAMVTLLQGNANLIVSRDCALRSQ